jgi:hypothetical protein
MSLVAAATADPRLWDPRGVSVSPMGRVEWERATAGNSSGYTAVAWSDMRTGNREVYAQLIDLAGNNLWNGSNGVQLTDNLLEQSQPVITATEGGWIVAWIDYRNVPRGGENSMTGGEVRLQKLNNQGDILWTAQGVRAEGTAQVYRGTLKLASDAAGGVLFAWMGVLGGNYDLCAGRITSAGEIAWPTVHLNTVVDQYHLFEAATDGSGGLFLTWIRSGSIYASRITPQGSFPFGTVVVQSQLSGGYGSVISADSSGGCYIAWFAQAAQTDMDIFAQRLNAAGQAQWNDGGVLVCDAPAEQYYPSVAPSLNAGVPDGCLLTWYDHRVGSNPNVYYTQKLDLNGTALWGVNGILLSDSVMSYQDLSLFSDGAGGLVTCWEDERQSYQNIPMAGYDIRATRLNSAGQPVWSPAIVPVSLATGDQWIPVLLPQSDRYAVLFQNGVYASDVRGMGIQMLNRQTGQRLLPGDGPAMLDRPTHNIQGAGAAPMSGGRTAVLWYERATHYQILNSDGHATLNADTALILPDSAVWYSAVTQTCPDGSGGFFAVLSSGDSEYGYTAFVAHMASDGHITGNGRARLLWQGPTGDYSINTALATPDSAGGCYVVFSYYSSPTSESYVLRLNSDCERIWTTPTTLEHHASIDVDNTKLITGADGNCLVAYKSEAGYAYHLARVNGDGQVLWNIQVSDTVGWMDYPKLTSDGRNGAYCTWLRSSSMTAGDYRVQAQHVAADGSVLFRPGGMSVSTLGGLQAQSRPLSDQAGNLIVIWIQTVDVTFERDVYAQKFSPDGAYLWADSGVAVCNRPGGQINPAVLSDNGDGAFVAWLDNDYNWAHVGATHLNADGTSGPDPYWVANTGGIISDSVAEVYDSPLLVPGADNSAIVLWSQDLGQSTERSFDCYAQRIVAASLGSGPEFILHPSAFNLSQNFPNPFNPTTRISFDLAKAGLTKLTLFNLLGQEVATLTNTYLTAGTHQVEWDAAALASGVYVYRLESGSFTASKKMVLLR